MNPDIHSYKDLLREKRRLAVKLNEQKILIRQDIDGLQEELLPIKRTVRLIGKLTTRDRSNALLNLGVDISVDFLFKRLLLSKSGWLTKIAIPFFVRNLSSNLLKENIEMLLVKLLEKLQAEKENGEMEAEGASTAEEPATEESMPSDTNNS